MAQIPVQGKVGLPTSITIGSRVVPLVLPNNYNARTKKYRLKIFLHSYGNVATATLNRYFASSAEAANSSTGAIVALPTGLIDINGQAYWNSNGACCALDAASPEDDVAFLSALITQAKARFAIDGVDIYGYSNGGMMAATLGLCFSGQVHAVYCYAGYTPASSDPKYCNPTQTVHVTVIWGDADTVVLYPGDPTGLVATDKPTGVYPGAVDSVTAWGALNGCSGTLTQYDSQDLTAGLAGAETDRFAFPTQATNGSVELWRVNGGSHVQGMATSFFRAIELRGYQCVRV
jgi:poly(3-hydroxybutyrate) depolymerase